MNPYDISIQRLQTQHLVGKPLKEPQDAVRLLGAMQAQDFHGAKWSIALRSGSATNEKLDKLYNEGKILRTHIMRPTWHFVMPEDIRWMQQLTSPRVLALSSHYYRKMGITDGLLKKTDKLIARSLKGNNYLTKGELSEIFTRSGIKTEPLSLGYMIFNAELRSIICSGPLKGKQFTYALLKERVPKTKTLSRDEALAELARRYFTSHGPATEQDYRWWSGLAARDTKAGLEMINEELEHETIEDNVYWFAKDMKMARLKKPAIHLLQTYDELLVAYKGFGASLAPARSKGLKLKSDIAMMNVITRNGMPIGRWKRTITNSRIKIATSLAVKLTKNEKDALNKAAESYGKFMGMDVEMKK